MNRGMLRIDLMLYINIEAGWLLASFLSFGIVDELLRLYRVLYSIGNKNIQDDQQLTSCTLTQNSVCVYNK